MNNFPAMTEEQRAELVQFNRAIIAQHESYAVSEAGWPDDVRLLISSARIALAALTAEKRLTVSVVQKNERLKGFNFEGYDSLPAGEHEFYTAPPALVLQLPAGWKLVPIEPTEAMMLNESSCQHHAWDDANCPMRESRRIIWKHMIEAAPEVK